MKYRIEVPPTAEMGNFQSIIFETSAETVAKSALHSYNNAREYDGLPPITRMPNGTKYILLKDTSEDMRMDKNKKSLSIRKLR